MPADPKLLKAAIKEVGGYWDVDGDESWECILGYAGVAVDVARLFHTISCFKILFVKAVCAADLGSGIELEVVKMISLLRTELLSDIHPHLFLCSC